MNMKQFFNTSLVVLLFHCIGCGDEGNLPVNYLSRDGGNSAANGDQGNSAANGDQGNSAANGEGGNPVVNFLTGTKVKKVTVGAGDAVITDKKEGRCHLKLECNNGLVIDVDWERNPYNDFGYDIYEPEVNMDYNRLAIMMTARGVIASYLKGEYD